MRTDLIKFSISIAVVVTVAVFAIGSIVASVNAQPSNFTVTGGVVLNCANGKSLTLADINKGQTCPSSNFTSPTPTPSASSNNTTVTPTPTPAVTKPTMITYKDPQGRFSLSYPSLFIAEPATNRFESTLVTFNDFAGGSTMIVTIIN
jgi:hypothetical protein